MGIVPKNITFSSIFFFLQFLVYGQVVFEKTAYHFGELSNWSQNPAVFSFYNPGPEQDAFLKCIKNTQVYIKYPNTYINPGESGKVLIYYEPNSLGNFSEKIKLFVASSEKPVELTITGSVTSILECPSLNLPPDKSQLISSKTIEVIDKNTKNKLANAQIKIISPDGKSLLRKTNRNGKVSLMFETGMYYIQASKEQYYTQEDYFYINKNSPDIIIGLPPVEEMSFENKDIIEGDTVQIIKEDKPLSPLINGLVINAINSHPVGQALVKLTPVKGISRLFTTGKDGKFSLTLNEGNYQIITSHKGYHHYSRFVNINEFTDSLLIELYPIVPEAKTPTPSITGFGQISGIVIDAVTEQAVKGANMKFINSYNVPSLFTTFKDGRFRKNLKKGEYRITIRAKGYQDYTDTLIVNGNRDGITYILFPENLLTNTEEPPQDKIIPGPTPTDTFHELPKEKYNANNIVFLIDVSSSMKQFHKLDYLKTSLIQLIKVLRDIDRITLISFSTQPFVHFITVTSDQKDTIISTISNIKAGGMTYGIQGMDTAYKIALTHFITNGNNQLIIATDGDFNSPDFSETELIRLISKYASNGISLSVIGFKTDKKSLKRMKRMALFGKGSLLVIENETQAKNILIDEIKDKSRKKE